MKVVIVDDEINSVNYISENLKRYEGVEVLKTFTDPLDALAFLIRNECDLLFLDIEMPGISGLYIAEQVVLLKPKTKFCFISAYNEGALKAFELNALDYIQKPFDKERFDICIKRYLASENNNDSISEREQRTLALSDVNQAVDYSLNMICGYDDENIVIINIVDIYYFEVINSVVYIHTKSNVYRANKPLSFYEEKLKEHYFFKTHKSYLVNLSKADHFSPRITYTYDMFFKDIEDVVPVSRSKVKELKEYFN